LARIFAERKQTGKTDLDQSWLSSKIPGGS
jgi:hypothetical protein